MKTIAMSPPVRRYDEHAVALAYIDKIDLQQRVAPEIALLDVAGPAPGLDLFLGSVPSVSEIYATHEEEAALAAEILLKEPGITLEPLEP